MYPSARCIRDSFAFNAPIALYGGEFHFKLNVLLNLSVIEIDVCVLRCGKNEASWPFHFTSGSTVQFPNYYSSICNIGVPCRVPNVLVLKSILHHCLARFVGCSTLMVTYLAYI